MMTMLMVMVVVRMTMLGVVETYVATYDDGGRCVDEDGEGDVDCRYHGVRVGDADSGGNPYSDADGLSESMCDDDHCGGGDGDEDDGDGEDVYIYADEDGAENVAVMMAMMTMSETGVILMTMAMVMVMVMDMVSWQ